MAGNDHDVSVLNTLITTTIDSANGFEEAAKDARSDQFKSMFQQFASDRRQCVSQLQQAVRQLGGDPEDDGSVKAAAHRTWLNLKDAVTGDSDKQIIEEVENGEDYIKGKYETALQDDRLSVQAKSIIEQAFRSVREGHDRASQLKHSMEGRG
ncbi:PA2169 family four-helix-bundle protein [Sphingomonas parva]|uniref:PA2169 family four-helix-bundle protein n=1 Tax=Sphingomonas parva TaxID=2555898 RepID=A0A4Y8ZM28_9SPHN|nr:PA2169 family four-helix-bundle protein [Sphingomonas parva]TFI57051.1 PA2169 family four-helix-bundle protein [Sphingomonas parva]